MSVVQQGGCDPSCRLMSEQQRIHPTSFLSMAICRLPRHLSVFVSRVFCPAVCSSGLSGSLGLALSLLPSLLLLFPLCQLSQVFRWNDAVTKRARQRLPDMPSQVFVFRGPSPPPPPLTLLPPPPDP